MTLTIGDYFERMSHIEPPPRDVVIAAADLIERVNMLLSKAAEDGLEEAAEPRVTSGWRTAAYNGTITNAAPKSKHITGQAIDLADPEGALDSWCTEHLDAMEEFGLWLEHPLATKGWTHLQSVPPRSGNRVFYP